MTSLLALVSLLIIRLADHLVAQRETSAMATATIEAVLTADDRKQRLHTWQTRELTLATYPAACGKLTY